MKRKRKQKAAPAQRRPGPGLDEASRASRALLGRDEEQRCYRPRQDDASIEDPLNDWPSDD